MKKHPHDDIVTRLRAFRPSALAEEAIAEILRLRERIAELEKKCENDSKA